MKGTFLFYQVVMKFTQFSLEEVLYLNNLKHVHLIFHQIPYFEKKSYNSYHFDKALMCILKITITLENHFSEEIMFEKKNIKG